MLGILPKSFFIHLKELIGHKILVGQVLWKARLYKRAFTHDLSKFTLYETIGNIKFIYKKLLLKKELSDNDRPQSWFYHRHINTHHPEHHMIDGKPQFMNFEDSLEMVCDMIATSRGKSNNEHLVGHDALYWLRTYYSDKEVIHPKTYLFLEKMFVSFIQHGYIVLNKKSSKKVYMSIKEENE